MEILPSRTPPHIISLLLDHFMNIFLVCIYEPLSSPNHLCGGAREWMPRYDMVHRYMLHNPLYSATVMFFLGAPIGFGWSWKDQLIAPNWMPPMMMVYGLVCLGKEPTNLTESNCKRKMEDLENVYLLLC